MIRVEVTLDLLISMFDADNGLPSLNHENSRGCDPFETTQMMAVLLPIFIFGRKLKGETTGTSMDLTS